MYILKMKQENMTEQTRKDTIGHIISFGHAGPDMTSSASGVVVFKNDEHIIVRHSCRTLQLAQGFNRRGLPHHEVEKITGCSIDTLRENEHDVFVDMMSPATYLAENQHEDGMYLTDEIDWDLAIVGKPVNGYTLVEVDGKFNFLKSGTHQWISDLWFDKATHFAKVGDEYHAFAKLFKDCYHLWTCDGSLLIQGQYPEAMIFDVNEYAQDATPEEISKISETN